MSKILLTKEDIVSIKKMACYTSMPLAFERLDISSTEKVRKCVRDNMADPTRNSLFTVRDIYLNLCRL